VAHHGPPAGDDIFVRRWPVIVAAGAVHQLPLGRQPVALPTSAALGRSNLVSGSTVHDDILNLCLVPVNQFGDVRVLRGNQRAISPEQLRDGDALLPGLFQNCGCFQREVPNPRARMVLVTLRSGSFNSVPLRRLHADLQPIHRHTLSSGRTAPFGHLA
jgi:hypothetical protein